MSDLKHARFDKFIVLQRGFDLPRKEMTGGPYPVVGSTSIIGYHNRYKVNPPGVVTGRSGSLGFVQYIRDKYWPHNTSLWVKDFKGNFPRYVYYHLLTLDLKRFNSGVGVPTLNRNDLDTLETAIPPLPTQRKIAAILSTYDNLIENNLRRIKVLEEMAQLIYREWFVNFRFPGHEKVQMVDSELGMIPEGWQVTTFGDLFTIEYGKTLPVKEMSSDGEYPVYGAGGVIGYHTKCVAQEKVALVTCRGNGSGTVWRTRGPAFITNNSLSLLPKDSSVNLEYYFVETLAKHSNVRGALSGSAQPQITIEGLSTVPAILPQPSLVCAYCDLVRPIPELVDQIYGKNINLHHTRDLLLPKLVTGELDVSELDIDIGEEPE